MKATVKLRRSHKNNTGHRSVFIVIPSKMAKAAMERWGMGPGGLLTLKFERGRIAVEPRREAGTASSTEKGEASQST